VSREPSVPVPLEGTQWSWLGLPDDPRPADFQFTLGFGEGQVTGTNLCNRFSGPATALAGDTVRLGPLAATEMACSAPGPDLLPYLAQQDFRFSLDRPHAEKWASRRLTLRGDRTTLVFTEHRTGQLHYNPDLEGGFSYLQVGPDRLTVVPQPRDRPVPGQLLTSPDLRPLPAQVGFLPGPFADAGQYRLSPLAVYGRPVVAEHKAVLTDISPSATATGWVYPDDPPLVEEIRALADPGFEARWLAAATQEHASIASFGQLLVELCALGAPSRLLLGVLTAAREEVEHTRRALTLVRAAQLAAGAGPEEAEAGIAVDFHCALPTMPAALVLRAAAELKAENWRDGVINEGGSADQLSATAVEYLDRRAARLAGIVDRIAQDERGHCHLAQAIDRWLADWMEYSSNGPPRR